MKRTDCARTRRPGLVETMYQERNRYLEELMQLPDAGGYGLNYPIVGVSRDMDTASQLRFAEAQIGNNESFTRRLHDRAASVLTPEQLRRFDQLQEEQIARVRANIERLRETAAKEANAPAR
jgi:hypothetical protein